MGIPTGFYSHRNGDEEEISERLEESSQRLTERIEIIK
jgi:hypothetical protein